MFYLDGAWHWKNPSTGTELIYSEHEQKWTLPSSDQPSGMQLIDGCWYHRDEHTGVLRVWDAERGEWVLRTEDSKPQESEAIANESHETEEDDFEFQLREEAASLARKESDSLSSNPHLYRDPSDNTVYEWDEEKRAWFPKVSCPNFSHFPRSYTRFRSMLTSSPSTSALTAIPILLLFLGWFEMDEEHITSVYVSGLPLDVTLVEFEEVMSKCGLIARDLLDKKLKLKLYKTDKDELKGDGLCTYIKKESVELAEKILDGYDIRGHKIKVQQARFELKGDYDPSKKEKQDRLFDWRPERLRGERPKSDNTVIIKNAFTLEELAVTCCFFTVEHNNKDGVVSVTFERPEEADDCITMMNWRVFRGRVLRADRWDGSTKYKIQETEEEAQQRLAHWQSFLDKPETSDST
ncbi:HIV Tat specific factor 1 [Trichuris trichiura]|uniref:HIV Tat specific factor 1 n=1 Tax=Trichuris trichiura TaxID=36087 RepID=A0A077YWM9_TRITR|nr:HIV Tat specific factor 1 [Trichuris trichiura]